MKLLALVHHIMSLLNLFQYSSGVRFLIQSEECLLYLTLIFQFSQLQSCPYQSSEAVLQYLVSILSCFSIYRVMGLVLPLYREVVDLPDN